MDPITAGLLGSAVIGGGLSMWGQSQANSANAQMSYDARRDAYIDAQANRSWQEHMRDSQYTSAVQDMKNAGINPMLAIMKGGNAGGSGGTASAPGPARMENTLSGTGEALRLGINSALEKARFDQAEKTVDANVKLAAAQEANQDAQTVANLSNAKLTEAKTKTEGFNTQKTASEWVKTSNQADLEAKRAAALGSELDSIAAKAKVDAATARKDLQYIDNDAIMRRASTWSGTAKNAAAAVGALVPKLKIDLNRNDREELDMHRSGSRGIPARRR